MQTHLDWDLRLIEEKTMHRFPDIKAQLLPCVGLSEDRFCESLGTVSTIRILGYFKYKLTHITLK
jgi:hypothetical protein